MNTEKLTVHADGKVHGLRISGPIIHAACTSPRQIDLWVLQGAHEKTMFYFRVFRDGELIHAQPGSVWHVKSVHDGDITVWHVFAGMHDELRRGAVPC